MLKIDIPSDPDAPKSRSARAMRENAVSPMSEKDWIKHQAVDRQRTLSAVDVQIEANAPFIVPVFNDLAATIYQAMETNGFWSGSQDNFGQKTALVHSELSEMLEANRKDIEADDKIPEFTGEEAEAADAIIRLLDMAGRYQWRLGEAVVAKMRYNLTRPYKHSKAY